MKMAETIFMEGIVVLIRYACHCQMLYDFLSVSLKLLCEVLVIMSIIFEYSYRQWCSR